MSLLLKALQNAAKNREAAATAGGESTPPPPAESRDSGATELSLEPVPASTRAQSTARAQTPLPEDLSERSPAPTPQHAQNVLRAGARSQPPAMRAPGIFSWLARRPLVAFSTIAGLFAIGYGVYLYMQIANPGIFVARRAAPPPASVATAPTPAAPPALAPTPTILPSGPVPVDPVPAPAAAGTSASGVPPSAPGSTPSAAVVATPPSPSTAPNGSSVQPRTPSGAGMAAAPSLPPSPPSAAIPSAPRSTGAPVRPDVVATTPHTEAVPVVRPRQVAKVSAAPARRTPSDGVGPASSGQVVPVDATLASAYQALEKGQADDAERMYRQVLASDARSVDALLGLASTLTQQNKGDAAAQLYMRVLEQDPRNAFAQAGLLSVAGRADPTAAEARLKQLISREPSAFHYFTLGNLYSEQGQWAAAQSAYFQAHNMAPDNPDYAFNLAVGLEHLSQPRIALNYYRRAVALAQTRGHAQFELARVQTRIRSLEAVLERP